ncbi:MAG: DUF721 domain-containing protein [Synergistaceae bacterium]|nr:DUF721 domain-containing protein [Synergistaceae bacterium]
MNPIQGAFGSLRFFFGLCLALSEIESGWEQIAGAALARRSRVKSYDDGVLVVAVENRSAEQDMNFRKGSIIKAISAKTFLKLKDIRTEITPVIRGTPRTGPHTVSRRRRRVAAVNTAELEKLKEDILSENPGLSEKLAETIAGCRLGGASVNGH